MTATLFDEYCAKENIEPNSVACPIAYKAWAAARDYFRSHPSGEWFEVLGSDLDQLDDMVSRENQALGFATASFGIAATTIISWAATATLTPTAIAIYAVVTGLSCLSTAWFGLVWHRVRMQRPRLLDRIRGRLVLKGGE